MLPRTESGVLCVCVHVHRGRNCVWSDNCFFVVVVVVAAQKGCSAICSVPVFNFHTDFPLQLLLRGKNYEDISMCRLCDNMYICVCM